MSSLGLLKIVSMILSNVQFEDVSYSITNLSEKKAIRVFFFSFSFFVWKVYRIDGLRALV